MNVGVPREIKPGEQRIALTPMRKLWIATKTWVRS